MAMEIPVINRISDFDVGINSINDPSFFSRAFAVSGIGKFHEAYSFWKWGALIIAFLASFSTLITKIKLLILRLRKIEPSLPSLPLLDDYDSESELSCSSSDEEDDDDDEEEDDETEEEFSGWRRDGDDFRVRGSGYYLDDDQGQNRNFTWRRRRSGSFGDLFSWPDLGGLGGSSVVKLWDHLDIGGASTSTSPAVVLAAEKSGPNSVEVRAWDTRAGFRMPALLAEWRQQPGRLLGKIIGVDAGGVEKIYVRDDVSGEIAAVGDMRRVSGALTDLTESDMDTWWDADDR